MSTMLDQLRELEHLIVELGAKMGCPFEEPQDRFRLAPIDLEMDSHGANPTGATSAEPRILGDSGETSSCNFGSCPRSPPMEASESSDRSLSRLERKILELPPRSSSSKARMELPTEMEESTNKLTTNLSQEPHTNNSFLEENSKILKKNHQSSGTSDSSLDGNSTDLKVIPSSSLESIAFHIASAMSEWIDASFDSIELGEADLKLNSIEFLVTFIAHKVYAKMLEQQKGDVDEYVELPNTFGDVFGSIDSSSSFVFDPGKQIEFSLHTTRLESWVILPFDPGIARFLLVAMGIARQFL